MLALRLLPLIMEIFTLEGTSELRKKGKGRIRRSRSL
jgi:hypothetical protein